MGWKNTRDFKLHHQRRMHRFAKIGRKFEQEELRLILEKMQDAGKISGFEIMRPNSAEDKDGKDAKVSKIIGGNNIEKFFGVTISIRSWNESKRFHPQTPQFCFPIGTKPETIEKRILSLFGASE